MVINTLNPIMKIDQWRTVTRIALTTPAPDFVLEDYNHQPFRLSENFGHENVLLVFNRGFT